LAKKHNAYLVGLAMSDKGMPKTAQDRLEAARIIAKAADEFGVNLKESFMIGDRLSDVIAGARAGCGTILLETGCHNAAPIVSDAFDAGVKPDYRSSSLSAAADFILGKLK
jgi:D-glycero-D-manno-heptose 1,7-bisphosphate phosphatase